MIEDTIVALPLERRLALAYAPQSSKILWLGLFALDARLGQIVAAAREPMLTQIKLAWWREELARPPAQRRRGEPLLEALDAWGEGAAGLGGMVDAWEARLGNPALEPEDVEVVLAGYERSCTALAEKLIIPKAETGHAARGWALGEIGTQMTQPAAFDWRRVLLPRAMRPLQILYALSARSRGKSALLSGRGSIVLAMRLGLFGI